MKHKHHFLLGLLSALGMLAAACAPAVGPALVTVAGPTSSSTSATAPASAAPSLTLPATGTAGPTPDPAVTAGPSATRAQDPASPPATAPATTAATTAAPGPSGTPGACRETQGQFTSLDVPSAVLGYPLASRIYLPPCYASSDQSYPVLYLIHGLNSTEDQWQRLGIGTAADRLITAGEIAPLIIVLPRDHDEDLRLDPALVTDLLPYVDGHYRTLASAGYRAIGGMSRGGGWSIHLGLRYSNLFGRVGADSPAIFYGDEINVLNYIRTAAQKGSGPALYIDIGAGDPNTQSAVWLDQMFTAYRLPHQYLVQPGSHDETYWGAHLDDYLRFYAAAWRPESMLSPTPSPSATRTATATRTPRPTRTPSPTRGS